MIVSFLQDSKIRTLLEVQSAVHFEVRDNEGNFGPNFPPGTDELYFIALEPINDIEHLRAAFELFAEGLHKLTAIGAASPDATGIYL